MRVRHGSERDCKDIDKIVRQQCKHNNERNKAWEKKRKAWEKWWKS